MPGDVPALLEAGRDALQLGDWSRARTAFDEALAADESAVALAGLGDACRRLGETDRAIHCQTRAYASFRRRPDPMQAAFMAIGLYLLYRVSVGSRAAARGWLGRATRLVEEFDLLPLSGWVALLRAHDSADVEAAHRWAREARDLARRFEDADLELCALSQLGAALVQLGRLDEGVPLLDEAMAASLAGEGKRLHTVVYTSCNMISSCSQVAEVARAAQWIRAADDFTRRYGCPHVYTLCRAYHGALLFAIGDWAGAEREYIAALRIGGSAERALRSQALAGLAELRLAQGRFEEAERLLEGLEEQLTSTSVLAALRLARGEASVAATLLRRRLRELDESADERPGRVSRGRRGLPRDRRTARAARGGRARPRRGRGGSRDRPPPRGVERIGRLRADHGPGAARARACPCCDGPERARARPPRVGADDLRPHRHATGARANPPAALRRSGGQRAGGRRFRGPRCSRQPRAARGKPRC